MFSPSSKQGIIMADNKDPNGSWAKDQIKKVKGWVDKIYRPEKHIESTGPKSTREIIKTGTKDKIDKILNTK
jgi:hypothetical protein